MNQFIKNISPYKPGRPIEEVAIEFGLNPDDIIKLASNENAFGVSPMAVEAMHQTVDQCFRYPDGGAIDLRRKIAEHYHVDIEQVLVGNGSNEILEFVGHCFMNPRTSTVVSAHTFVVYKLVTQLFGARLIEVKMTNGLVHDIEAMVHQIQRDTSIIFICNPNNPTGTRIPVEKLENALKKIPSHVLIVLDEAYAEVSLGTLPNALERLKRQENLLICRTFSKGYGLAGLRLGYGIGNKELVQILQKARQPFNVNLMSQNAGIAALDDQDFLRKGRDHYRESKCFFENLCKKLKIDYIPTCTNFMLLKVGEGAEVAQKLLKKGIIIRAMEGYGLSEYIRITFGTTEENQRLANALSKILSIEHVE